MSVYNVDFQTDFYQLMGFYVEVPHNIQNILLYIIIVYQTVCFLLGLVMFFKGTNLDTKWCRRHQLRQLDHTILSGHFQSSQTEVVHSHPVQTPSHPCHAVQSETHYRSLHFGRGTHPIPPGSTRLFPFRNTGCLDPTFSTISTAALPRTLGPLSRPRSPYRRTLASWYPIWSIHSFGTYQPLGEKYSSTGGYTRSTHLSR